MKVSYRLSLLAVALALPAVFVPTPLARQVLATIAALALLAVAIEAPPGLLRHLGRVLIPWLASFVVAAAFLAAQLAPTPLAPAAHPIWQGVAAALSPAPPGHTTIDVGATLVSLEAALAGFALATAAAAVAIDRLRAERLASGFAAIAGAAAVAGLAIAHAPAAWLGAAGAAPARAPLAAIAGLGLIVDLALIAHAVDFAATPGERPPPAALRARLALLGLGAVASLAALATTAPPATGVAVAFGVLALVAVTTIRRLALTFWPAALTAVAAVAIAAVTIAHGFAVTAGDLVWRFATSADPAAIAAGDRALADLGWLGAGAGTADQLLAAYREFGETLALRAPTVAAEWTIGLGRAGFAIVVVWALGAAAYLLGCGLARGRDWVYAAAAGAATLTLTAAIFTDAALTTPAVAALAAAALGLGVGQSVSRSVAGPP